MTERLLPKLTQLINYIIHTVGSELTMARSIWNVYWVDALYRLFWMRALITYLHTTVFNGLRQMAETTHYWIFVLCIKAYGSVSDISCPVSNSKLAQILRTGISRRNNVRDVPSLRWHTFARHQRFKDKLYKAWHVTETHNKVWCKQYTHHMKRAKNLSGRQSLAWPTSESEQNMKI